MKKISILSSFIVLYFVPISRTFSQIQDSIKFELELVKHQPCHYDSEHSHWDRILEFEGGDESSGPRLLMDPNEPNCYNIKGKTVVFKEFRGNFSAYIELRNSISGRKVPEVCINQQPDGCGGIGSCLYCNACNSIGSFLGAQARLLVNGESLKCTDALKPGVYQNVTLRFCLPSLETIFNYQGFRRESLLSLMQYENNKTLRGIGLFLTVYIFNTDVSPLMRRQLRIEKMYRHSRSGLFKNEPLPVDFYWQMPFSKMIKERRNVLACHKIFGNIEFH